MSHIFSSTARVAAPVATLVLAMGIAGPGWSHHSRAEFADETIEIRGTLVSIIWRNLLHRRVFPQAVGKAMPLSS